MLYVFEILFAKKRYLGGLLLLFFFCETSLFGEILAEIIIIHSFINGFATSLTFCNSLFPQRNKSPCKVIETCSCKVLMNYLGM